jgi:hypothetical protein
MMEERRKSVRRAPNDYFLVFDRENDRFIGRVLNMSMDGVMLVSMEPVKVPAEYTCRMALPEKIDDCNQIIFDAESIWSRRNENSNMYETGLKLKNVSSNDREIIRELLQRWLAVQADSLGSWIY